MRIILLLLALCGNLGGATFEERFAVVFIDAETERKLGRFPLDRSLLAKATERASEANARGVVLKFFLDQPKSGGGDTALAKAMTNLPVVLQARLDDSEPKPNVLPTKFFLTLPGVESVVSGASGWVPLPMFAEKAKDVGFIDFSGTNVPLLEKYQGKPVKSVVVCCLELALQTPAEIIPGKKIAFGSSSLAMDRKNCVQTVLPRKDVIDYIPFHQLVSGEAPRQSLRDKVIIIGYDGEGMHSLPSPLGEVKAHRLFVYSLKDIFTRLETNR